LSPARREKGLSLNGLPTKSLDALLVRCVPQLGFDAGNPPSYFFASGRAHRLNPAGVYCLYFSEDEATANAEYQKGIEGTLAANQAYRASGAMSAPFGHDTVQPSTMNCLK
jgi:hypothetical protein